MSNLEYDYIVIGAGTAGATIAKTLSDNRRNSVLLLEAGENDDEDEPIRNSTFAPVLQNLFFPEYFWQGEGVPQEELNNRTFRWTGGRLLGGSSSVNRQLYVRPTPAIFEKWQQLLGPLWSPQEAVRGFKELEKYNGITDNPAARGFNGRLDVRQAPVDPTQTAEDIVLAIEQATGFHRIIDYNNPNTPIGPFVKNQYTQKPNGTRESSSTAFLSRDIINEAGFGVNGRKLRLLTKSTALRIIFCNKIATGVRFLKEGKSYEAYARKKVIVSTGIKSPKLLMLSGIGPADELRSVGIPVIVDNPNVGHHLANHSIIAAVFSINPPPPPPVDPNAHLIAGAFLPNPIGINPTLREIQLEPFLSNSNTLVIGISPIQPKSRGSINIQANDPLKIELGDEEFLDNPADMELLKNAFRIYIQNIAKALNPKYTLISPTLDIINNDTSLENFIRQNLSLTFHEESTLRMAPSKALGVVNFRGEVFGVRNLVVADNSIIPFTVDGNTSAIAYLIGLKIAQQLLEEEDNCR
ncbi:GMC family oxidoreductase N-terminal domain-containing protein [Clostridium beijerinckii]|uniref:GMC family oxidoreductase N-terminal domain-containing protein n=1 Tax=Clostridium beijerinckii TaxID=1520 RepID=UPI00156D5B54|nr:choline dehydrogenase [Clostridium beijerinckii]